MFEKIKTLITKRRATHKAAHPEYPATITRWLILQAGPNPSTDYYIRPRAEASGLPVIYRDIQSLPHANDLSEGTFVVIVRYLNKDWAQALKQHANDLSGAAYFMDDDLLDHSTWHDLPKSYRKKLRQSCLAMQPQIFTLASEYWVSTQILADKYQKLGAVVMPPRPVIDQSDGGLAGKSILIFYHGTQSHMEEIRWLQPIIEQVLAACPQAHFEIIGNHEINKLYRDLPRTRILHPMSWPNYLVHCRSLNGHIGLAPLLTSNFNTGRSHAKALDIARCSAIGVYSDSPIYRSFIRDGENGWTLPNQPDLWVDKILYLVTQMAVNA